MNFILLEVFTPEKLLPLLFSVSFFVLLVFIYLFLYFFIVITVSLPGLFPLDYHIGIHIATLFMNI